MNQTEKIQALKAFQDEINRAMDNNDEARTKELFQHPEFGEAYWDHYLCVACSLDDPRMLDAMLAFDLPIKSERPLLGCMQREDLEGIQKILPRMTNPPHADIVEKAALLGGIDMVRLLLPYGDPKINRSQALAWVSQRNNQEAFDLLYPLSDPQACLALMIERNYNEHCTRMLTERMALEHAQEQHTMILEQLPEKPSGVRHKI